MTSAIRTTISQAAHSLPYKDKLYMSFTYLFGCKSSIKMIGKDEAGKPYVKFMETIFHPQGGGQPCDLGQFSIKNEKRKIAVLDVQKEKIDGRADLFDVRHYVSPEDAEVLALGQEINMEINPDRRLLNARLHTCGHLIAALVADSRFPIVVKGGHHFPGEANVVFKFTSLVEKEINEKTEAAKAANKNISKKQIEGVKSEVLEKLKSELDSYLKEKIENAISEKLPVEILNNEGTREIEISGYEGVPCGGTHIGSIYEITKAVIKGISIKKDELKVSYGVVGEDEGKVKN